MRPSNACSRSRVMSARPLNRHCRFHDAILWPSHSEATSAHLGRRRRQRPAPNRGPVRRLRQHRPTVRESGPNFDRGLKRNTDYPGFRERVDFVRRSETGGAKFLPEASAQISISGDIESCESCAHPGKLAAISPTNTIPAGPDFISTSSSNSTSTKSTKSMRMPGEKCTSRNIAGPCYTNRNVTDFMESKAGASHKWASSIRK